MKVFMHNVNIFKSKDGVPYGPVRYSHEFQSAAGATTWAEGFNRIHLIVDSEDPPEEEFIAVYEKLEKA